jgi:hypothetical protein
MLLMKISRRLSREYTMSTALPRYCWDMAVRWGSREYASLRTAANTLR